MNPPPITTTSSLPTGLQSTSVHTGEDPRAWEETTRACDGGSLVAKTPTPKEGVQACSWQVPFPPSALIVCEGQWGKIPLS